MVMEWGREEEENAGQLHIFTRVKSRRCANILRASGYLEYSRIWLLFSPDNTTSQQSSLRPGNGGYISNQALVRCCIHGEMRERAINNRNLLHV